MLLVFARGRSDDLIGLIKRVNDEIYRKPLSEARAFVVFLEEPTAGARDALAAIAKEHGLEVPLTLNEHGPKNPPRYAIPAEARATVIAYEERRVKRRFDLRAGEIDEKSIAAMAEAARALRGGS